MVISSTCYDKLADLFVETCIFYRPALTPAVLYAESMNEVITHEGPQAVCAALSFAINFQPSNLVLVGVDLGTADTSKPRSEKAKGYSPRSLEETAEGNFQDIVYTDKMLLDCRDVLSSCIFTATTMGFKGSILNASNGLKISGANACELSEYKKLFDTDNDAKQKVLLDHWLSSLAIGSVERMSAIMNLRKPRAGTLALIDDLREILDPSLAWMPTLVHELNIDLISLVCPKASSTRRIIKSSILKAVNTTTRIFSE